MEKHWQSRDGKRFLHIGGASRIAVGSGERPSEVIPLQEGARLLLSLGIDRWWRWIRIFALGMGVRSWIRRKRRTHKSER